MPTQTIAALNVAAQSPSVYSIGVILDTPFLYQERYPIESEYEGGYYQRIVYTYDPGQFWYVVDYRWIDTRGRLVHLSGEAYYEGELDEQPYRETYTYRDDETRFFFPD